MKKMLIVLHLFLTITASSLSFAQLATPITFWGKVPAREVQVAIIETIKSNIPIADYREVKVQAYNFDTYYPKYVLVFLLSKKYHQMQIARIDLSDNGKNKLIFPYRLSSADRYRTNEMIKVAKCPDNDIEFIAFAPNDMEFELEITGIVANSARSHGLKTVFLSTTDATSQNYLNYMKCPKLKGNFYDGDADEESIVTNDGVISFKDLRENLPGQFNYKVTNIWLACNAFNNPMLSTMIDVVKSQKYAAGINPLLIGPSDFAAACTFQLAFEGTEMHSAFDWCYKHFDTEEDKWGFAGKGSRYFGM